jgi:hypothetical protein
VRVYQFHHFGKKTKADFSSAFAQCPELDSNQHTLRHYPLKVACLPISPPGHLKPVTDFIKKQEGVAKVKSFSTFLKYMTTWADKYESLKEVGVQSN